MVLRTKLLMALIFVLGAQSAGAISKLSDPNGPFGVNYSQATKNFAHKKKTGMLCDKMAKLEGQSDFSSVGESSKANNSGKKRGVDNSN